MTSYPHIAALVAFREDQDRWPSQCAPYPTMPFVDGADTGHARTERLWLDFTERELANWISTARRFADAGLRRALEDAAPGWDQPRTSGRGTEPRHWQDRLTELASFVAEHHRLPSSSREAAKSDLEVSLYRWLLMQRRNEGRLPLPQRVALDRAAPGWDTPRRRRSPAPEDRFVKRAADLARFRAEQDRWPSTRSPLQFERSLASWVREQRRGAPAGRRQLLDETVPGWDQPRRVSAGHQPGAALRSRHAVVADLLTAA